MAVFTAVLSSVSADPAWSRGKKKVTTTWVLSRVFILVVVGNVGLTHASEIYFIAECTFTTAERRHLTDILSTDEIVSVSRFWDNARRGRSCTVLASTHITLTKVFRFRIRHEPSVTNKTIDTGGGTGWLWPARVTTSWRVCHIKFDDNPPSRNRRNNPHEGIVVLPCENHIYNLSNIRKICDISYNNR